MAGITARCKEIRKSIPPFVTLVAATKERTAEEIEEAIDAGIEIIGENYVQEAVRKYAEIGDKVKWHGIGHLQRNKVKNALKVFDCIQSVDSLRLVKEIDKQSGKLGRNVSILVEINIADEESKYGIKPDETLEMIQQIAPFQNLHIEGLMTMEPYLHNPEDARPYFKRMKQLFDDMGSQHVANVEMKILSMGMSNSYEVAIEEGSNMVRIGTKLFGPRKH